MDYRCVGLYQNGLDHMDARQPNDIVESVCFLVPEKKKKRARMGSLPGVTQDIAGYKVYWYQVLDIETGLKLALA
ncbi:hypothetical protein PanWU01x14_236710, partial [Parasponia andersonii]